MSKIFAKFYADGTYGFYPEEAYPPGEDGEPHPGIPEGSVEVSQEDYDRFFNDGALWVWNTDGSLIARPPPPKFVPASVSMRQAKLSLHRAGYLAPANQIIAGMPGEAGEEARIEWQYATSLDRANPLVEQLGMALGLTVEQVDDLFIAADLI